MAIFKCRNEKCGLIFEWSIIRPYVREHYQHMIDIGTLERDAVVKVGDTLIRVKFHPTYYHPYCPSCGSHSDWIYLYAKRRRR